MSKSIYALDDSLELASDLNGRYATEWREMLAAEAADQAIRAANSPEEIATMAARIALGLQPLQEQGEQ